MSTVAAVRKGGRVAIAADTLTKRGSAREPGGYVVNCSKIIRVNESYLGITGPTSGKVVLQHYFSNLDEQPDLTSVQGIFETWRKLHHELRENYFLLPHEDESDSFESTRMDVLIVNPAGIFGVAAHRSIQEFSRFYACGTGADHALGAMYVAFDSETASATDIARRGVEAAAEFDDSTGLPLESFTLSLTGLE